VDCLRIGGLAKGSLQRIGPKLSWALYFSYSGAVPCEENPALWMEFFLKPPVCANCAVLLPRYHSVLHDTSRHVMRTQHGTTLLWSGARSTTHQSRIECVVLRRGWSFNSALTDRQVWTQVLYIVYCIHIFKVRPIRNGATRLFRGPRMHDTVVLYGQGSSGVVILPL
jgi:hypothetical protein